MMVCGFSLSAQQADSAEVLSAVTAFQSACARDHGRLWGRTLCGAVVVADAETRFAIATAKPPEGSFVRRGAVYVGHVPEGLSLANTSIMWAGEPWASVRLPLSGDSFGRIALLAHESFHRLQPALHLDGVDAMNPQLDERVGRFWLRLELRALAAALTTHGAQSRAAAHDALLFRTARNARYPGSDTLEAALERQEGLAEYTGDRIAMLATGATAARVAQDLRQFESRPTYVRSFAYATGPGLGLLLDRFAAGWRQRLQHEGMAYQLERGLGFRRPEAPVDAATARAGAYGGTDIARLEDVREEERQRMLTDYRARLVTGPVLVLHQDHLSRAFNPNTLVPLPEGGTIYPTGTFAADWGSLDVTAGGALLSADYRELRLSLPGDTTGDVIHGEGWTLKLAPGWRLRPAGRSGDMTAGK